MQLPQIGIALVVMAMAHGCLFEFPPEDGASGGQNYDYVPFDPGSGETGSMECGSIDPDGTCHPVVLGVACTCPWDYACDGTGTVWSCSDNLGASGHCTATFRNCWDWSENQRGPKQTCVENGPHGTGCYVEGSVQPDGWVRHCDPLPPCENGTPKEDCVVMPQVISVDFTYPSAGSPYYSCFEHCLHTIYYGSTPYECGACCAGCNISATQDEALCGGNGTSSSTGGGGCPDLDGIYQSTGDACIDRCVDDVLGCFAANGCEITSSCTQPYEGCVQNCF